MCPCPVGSSDSLWSQFFYPTVMLWCDGPSSFTRLFLEVTRLLMMQVWPWCLLTRSGPSVSELAESADRHRRWRSLQGGGYFSPEGVCTKPVKRWPFTEDSKASCFTFVFHRAQNYQISLTYSKDKNWWTFKHDFDSQMSSFVYITVSLK